MNIAPIVNLLDNSQVMHFPDGGSVLSDADTSSQCGQSDALSSLPPGDHDLILI